VNPGTSISIIAVLPESVTVTDVYVLNASASLLFGAFVS
jgi:hypothetical protein